MSAARPEEYIGDGLYVRRDAYGMVILRAPCDGHDDRVALEPQVLEAFQRWLSREEDR